MADGEGGFAGAAAYPLDTTANVRDVVVADLTGDGAPEVVVAGGRVQVLTNDGEGGLPSRWQTGTTDATDYHSPAVAGDFDGDDQVEVLLGRRRGGLVLGQPPEAGGYDLAEALPARSVRRNSHNHPATHLAHTDRPHSAFSKPG